ncbi:MAG TPA: hypothetical protein VFA09_20485 [Ktedonobacteraceae bacterium]|nr:hypothetical protein [Ktedonobacteraceae bacterium]
MLALALSTYGCGRDYGGGVAASEHETGSLQVSPFLLLPVPGRHPRKVPTRRVRGIVDEVSRRRSGAGKPVETDIQ